MRVTVVRPPDQSGSELFRLLFGGAAGRVVGPVAVEPDHAPFDALAVAGEAAILDDREMHLAQLAVREHGFTGAIAARDVVGGPGPERGLVNGGEAGDLQRGIPERAFLLPELRGDRRQRP